MEILLNEKYVNLDDLKRLSSVLLVPKETLGLSQQGTV
jgi:hypothetical protein